MTLHGTHQALGRYGRDPRIEPGDWGYSIDYGPGYTLAVDGGAWRLYRAGDDQPVRSDTDVERLLDWLLGEPQVRR